MLAPGPPAIIPAPLQRTSCLWVHPHQPGQQVLSLLSPSNSSSKAPCSAHCKSLKAPWERPLWSPSPPGLQLCASRRCAPPCREAPQGLEEPMLPSRLPSLPSPMPRPACLSLGSRPHPPWGYSSVPCTPSQPCNAGCPTALPLHPISLHQHMPGDFTMLMPLNVICMPTTPSPP